MACTKNASVEDSAAWSCNVHANYTRGARQTPPDGLHALTTSQFGRSLARCNAADARAAHTITCEAGRVGSSTRHSVQLVNAAR